MYSSSCNFLFISSPILFLRLRVNDTNLCLEQKGQFRITSKTSVGELKYLPDGPLFFLDGRCGLPGTIDRAISVGWRLHAHELCLLELFAPNKVPSESGGDFSHHGGRVLVHRVVAGFREISHKPENGNPQC